MSDYYDYATYSFDETIPEVLLSQIYGNFFLD